MSCTPGDQSIRKDEYVFNYESSMTTEYLATRTAEANGGFFLPYLKPGMNLLDCGCGSGSITVGLAERVAPGQVTGVDVGESEIEVARKRADEQGVSNARFDVASVYELPFPDNAFDAVFTHNMPEHLDNPLRAFQEMHRVLKPGGVVGVRDIDAGRYVAHGPKADQFKEAIHLLLMNWANVSGSPYMGRHLRELLREAGFANVLIWASYDNYPTQEALTNHMDIMASAYEEQAFIDRVTESGLADKQKISESALAIREFGRHPDSIFANAHFEAVGWKG